MITFTVYGEPVAAARPRFARRGNFVTAYDPAKSRDYKTMIRQEAALHRQETLIEEPLRVAIKVYRSVPKSWSQKKQKLALEGNMRPTSKPDLSNYIKLVEDALNQVVIKDDSQIVSLDGSGKWYSTNPRIEVVIETLGEINDNRG